MAGRSNDVAAGCLTLFGLAFLAPGAFVLWEAFRRAAAGDPERDAWLVVLAGLAFAGFGGGVVLLAFYGRRKLHEADRLRARYPDEPWRQVAGWAEGRIRSSDRATAIAIWVGALVWNAMAMPLLFAIPDEVRDGNHLALIGLIFPAVGIGLVVWALRATARWRKFGTSVLHLAASPVPLGGVLAGAIVTRLDAAPERVRLRLSCVSRSRGSDDETRESLLWHDTRTVPGSDLRREPDGLAVPFSVEIPSDAAATDREGSPSIHWRLEADASVAGADYASRFELPVFRTPDALVEASRQHAREVGPAEAPPFDPRDASVRIGPGRRGGTAFRFGAARNPGPALGSSAGAALFLGVAYGARQLGAPLAIPLAFGAIGIPIAVGALDLWLTVTTVEVGNDVAIRHAALGIGRTRRIPRGDVVEVGVGLGRGRRESAVRSARSWYDVRLRLADGRHVSAGRLLRDRREAEWIAGELRRALGLD